MTLYPPSTTSPTTVDAIALASACSCVISAGQSRSEKHTDTARDDSRVESTHGCSSTPALSCLGPGSDATEIVGGRRRV